MPLTAPLMGSFGLRPQDDSQRGRTPRILLVTDPAYGDDGLVACVQAVASAVPAGVLGVQLRDKQRPHVSLRVFASHLRVVTRAIHTALFINGDARLARDVGADGVHLGRDAGTVQDARAVLGKQGWISVAAHSDEDVRRAIGEGADAVLVSPVFDSRPPSVLAPTKQGRGLQALRTAKATAAGRVAIYALGGVDADNARACVEAGADGVAVVRALLASPEPARVARALCDGMAGR